MKILILGVSGFIGGNLFRKMQEFKDYEVYGVYFKNKPKDMPETSLLQADLTNLEDVRRVLSGVDVVIQAAANTTGVSDVINAPYVHVTENAIMNSLLLRESHLLGVKKFVFMSCTVMYQKESSPFRSEALVEEDDNLDDEIFRNYIGVGWTKVYIEKMCKFYSSLGSMKAYCVRHSNVYGRGDKFDLKKSHVLGATINKVINSKDNQIHVWGDGSEKREFIYIDDLIDAVCSITKTNFNFPYSIWNIGTGKMYAIKELVQKICIHAGRPDIKINFDTSKPTVKTGMMLNCDKAAVDFGWHPTHSLDEGLKLTIDWYKNNGLK